jgi:DNA-binding NtrC family response regulator
LTRHYTPDLARRGRLYNRPRHFIEKFAQQGEVASRSFEGIERQLVVEALAGAKGNQSKAARQLKIGRDALRYKMKKYGLL